MTRRIRTLGVLLAVAALAWSAPPAAARAAPAAARGRRSPVAQNVQVPGSPTFAAMQQRGRLVIGVKNDQPGLGIQDPTTGQYTGFDIEIGRMIAAGLGFGPGADRLQGRPVGRPRGRDRPRRRRPLRRHLHDQRQPQAARLFAGPYFVAGQDLLVRADDQSITGPQTLQGKKVCSATGSTPIQRVRQQNLTQNVVEFQNYSQCVDALRAGQVDAVTTDNAILAGLRRAGPRPAEGRRTDVLRGAVRRRPDR